MPLQPKATVRSSYHKSGTVLESLKTHPLPRPLPLLPGPPQNHEVLAGIFPPPTHKP